MTWLSRCASRRWVGLLRQAENYISQHPRGARTTVPESLSVNHPAFRFLPLTADRETRDMWGRSAWRLLRSESLGGRRVSAPRWRFSPALRRGEEGPVSRGRGASQRKDAPASPRPGCGCHAPLPGALRVLETPLPGLAPGGQGLGRTQGLGFEPRRASFRACFLFTVR